MKQLLFIVGPTASGKSGFAVECAKLLNTEIISCDSMQVYKKMNVGTAKITETEMQGVKHHMLNVVEPFCDFSVAQYKDLALPIINDLLDSGKTPIICGGTGLYVDSIIYPLNFSDTNKRQDLRDQLLAELEEKGPKYMHDKLASLDLESAEKIHENDIKRLIRALEINISHGKREKNELSNPSFSYLMVGFSPENRAELYDKINARVDEMFNNGVINEVKSLINEGVTFDLQAMQAIGYKEFKAFFDGEIDETRLKELIKQHTRNYAKRQITWFKKYKDIIWFQRPSFDALQFVKNTFLG